MEKGKEKLEGIYFTYLNKYLKWLKNETEDLSKIKISQHTKKAKISVTSNLTKDIKLKIVATPDDWIRLAEQYDPKALGIGIEYRFILPVLFELWPLKKPRGKLRNALAIGAFTEEASFLYAFFSFWVKRPTEEWPDYLKKLLIMAKNDGQVILVPNGKEGTNSLIKKLMKKGTNAPYRLTRYCMEKAFEKSIKWSGRRLFDDPANFLKNYIHKHSRAKRVAMLFIKGKSSKEVANLAYKPPLENIFKRLKIM